MWSGRCRPLCFSSQPRVSSLHVLLAARLRNWEFSQKKTPARLGKPLAAKIIPQLFLYRCVQVHNEAGSCLDQVECTSQLACEDALRVQDTSHLLLHCVDG
jgi:hypothetical protein